MSAPYSPGHGRILHAGGMTSSAIGRSVAEMDEQGVARTDAERVERGPGGGDGLVGIDLAPGQLLVAVEFEPRQLERIVAGPEHLHPDTIADGHHVHRGGPCDPRHEGDLLLRS